MDKLKIVIEEEKRRDPRGFRAAEEKGELLKFLDPALKKANVNPVHLERLLEENNHTDYVELASKSLDEVFFEPFYQHYLPSNHMGLAEVMANLKSSSKVLAPLKQIKVFCAISAFLFFGLGIRYGIKKYVPHSLLFFLLAADLFRVSYNCYDKKYCSLYLNMIGGSATKAADTIFKFVSSMVGMAEPTADPLIGLRNEVVWRNLIQDTFGQALYMKVPVVYMCSLAEDRVSGWLCALLI